MTTSFLSLLLVVNTLFNSSGEHVTVHHIIDFKVQRTGTKVELIWKTEAQPHDIGFVLQRRTKKGEWERIAFIFPQHISENKGQPLIYEYTDVNIVKEATQYRLRQVDRTKQLNYSDVVTIRGYEPFKNDKASIR